MGDKSYEAWLAALHAKRAPAEAEARRLIEHDRFDEAARTIKRVDDSIYGEVALARILRERLEQLVASGEARRDDAGRRRAEAVFAQALSFARSAYPEPHTQCEADNFERGRAEDLARLVRILGYNPGTEPRA